MSPQVKTEQHLSHSQVTEFLRCPRRYHLHRRLGIPPEFCPSGLLFGSAVHEALSLYHQMRLEGRKATLPELCEAFNARWDEEPLPVKFKPGESQESLKAKATRMLSFYLKNATPAHEVIAVEEPFRITVSEEIPAVIGRIDLIEKAEGGQLILTDFKTAGSRREPDPGQLVLYREAVRQLDYPGNGSVDLKYEVLLKGKEPDIVIFQPQVTEEDVSRLRSLYRTAWRDIRSGCSFPSEGWWCGDCQWQGACKSV